jgi:hypothetical protein
VYFRLLKGTIVMSNMDSRKEEARKREAKRITRENIALMRQDTLSIASSTTSY